MRYLKYLVLLAALAIPATYSRAQVSFGVGVQIGAPPVCEYGFYSYAPYACAPYGYWGPEWFADGIFIGAGPWFHGPEHFHGYVDNRYRPDHGYHGEYPHHGDRPRDGWHGSPEHFHGNEWRDGHGHDGGHR